MTKYISSLQEFEDKLEILTRTTHTWHYNATDMEVLGLFSLVLKKI